MGGGGGGRANLSACCLHPGDARLVAKDCFENGLRECGAVVRSVPRAGRDDIFERPCPTWNDPVGLPLWGFPM